MIIPLVRNERRETNHDTFSMKEFFPTTRWPNGIIQILNLGHADWTLRLAGITFLGPMLLAWVWN